MGARPKYSIAIQADRFDVGVIHDFLRSCYWAKDIPRRVVVKSIRNSLCVGAFFGKTQVGFARAITDRATFAYLADVFVVPEHRGRGVGKMLVRNILAHPEMKGLRRILLATQDAHGLYTPFGFKPPEHPEHFLTIHFPDVYARRMKKRSKRRSAP